MCAWVPPLTLWLQAYGAASTPAAVSCMSQSPSTTYCLENSRPAQQHACGQDSCPSLPTNNITGAHTADAPTRIYFSLVTYDSKTASYPGDSHLLDLGHTDYIFLCLSWHRIGFDDPGRLPFYTSLSCHIIMCCNTEAETLELQNLIKAHYAASAVTGAGCSGSMEGHFGGNDHENIAAANIAPRPIRRNVRAIYFNQNALLDDHIFRSPAASGTAACRHTCHVCSCGQCPNHSHACHGIHPHSPVMGGSSGQHSTEALQRNADSLAAAPSSASKVCSSRNFALLVNAACASYKRTHLCALIPQVLHVYYEMTSADMPRTSPNHIASAHIDSLNTAQPLAHQCLTAPSNSHTATAMQDTWRYANHAGGVLHGAYRYLKPLEVSAALHGCMASGIFSEKEGACWASTEALLCGVPVISTSPSKGGRDVWYTAHNCVLVPEPATAQAVAAAVEVAVSKLASGEFDRAVIRAEALALAEVFRDTLRVEVKQILLTAKVPESEVLEMVRELTIPHKMKLGG